MIQIPVSILELAVVNQNSNAKEAIDNSMKVARLADSLGYERIWFAEHHNTAHIASSATALLIQLAAGQTEKIRVGSGGIMLPNHSPLVVAEQFGTLETLYPGRIDLGLGRAPGTDRATAEALRRNHIANAHNFANEIEELQNYFSPEDKNQTIHAFPGKGLNIPVWILGSSTSSALLAAQKGLPYAFATHFAPAQFYDAVELYRKEFIPSKQWKEPYVIACVNAVVADTDEHARFLSTSLVNLFVNLTTQQRHLGLLPPGKISDYYQIPQVQRIVNNMTAFSFIGSKSTVQQQLGELIKDTQIDELMITSHIYSIDEKLKSFEFIAEMTTAH